METLSNALGLLGSILLTVPWALQFLSRRKLDFLKRVRAASPGLKRLLEARISDGRSFLEQASSAELFFTLVGLLCLVASFAVKLAQ